MSRGASDVDDEVIEPNRAAWRTRPVTDLIDFVQMLAVVLLAALPIVLLVRLIDSDPGFDDPTPYGRRVEELHPLVLGALPK